MSRNCLFESFGCHFYFRSSVYTYIPMERVKRLGSSDGYSLMATRIPVTKSDAVALALNYIKLGRVVALPTDTVYGFACDATNVSAIEELYSVKCRNENKPLAICVGNVSDVKKWAKVEHLPKGLISTLLPGPVTLILPCDKKLEKSLCCSGKIGVRIPDYGFIRNVAKVLNKPLALTSANLSNTTSAVNINEFKSLWGRISVVFDGGQLGNNRSASTVVDLSEIGKYYIVREGMAYDHTEKVLQRFGLTSKY